MEGFSYQQLCFCALNRIFGFNPRLGRKLCTFAGGAPEVFSLPKPRLRELLGKDASLAEEIGPGLLDRTREELDRICGFGGTFLSIEDEGYPEILLECPDPPLGIYLRTNSDPGGLFGSRPAIAVVGTRKVTPYGADSCRRIVKALSDCGAGPVIISGLAFGTDRIAHETALQCGLPTIGVMATGIDTVYPWQHRSLALEMASMEGCALLTDYPPGTQPVALNFMRRNRIIAGLATATIVIESAVKGGSLITARYANEYSRDVFALPGRLTDPMSSGCNRLLRNRMADIIADPESLIERLGFHPPRKRDVPGAGERIALLFRDSLSSSDLTGILKTAEIIAAHPGITPERMTSLTGRPYRETAEDVSRLAAAGILDIDILQQCTLKMK